MHDIPNHCIDPINKFEDNPDYDNAMCRRCGKAGLTISKVGQQWKLFEHNGLRLREHECEFSEVFGDT